MSNRVNMVGESFAPDTPPDQRREPINIHPDVRDRLRTLLFHPKMRAVGYSEFITRALDVAEKELRDSADELDCDIPDRSV